MGLLSNNFGGRIKKKRILDRRIEDNLLKITPYLCKEISELAALTLLKIANLETIELK